MFTKSYTPNIYPWPLVVAIGDDIDQLSARFPDTQFDDGSALATTRFTYDRVHDTSCVLVHFFGVGDASDPEIAGHEAVHASNFYWGSISASPDINNDEPYAYLTGWICGRIADTVRAFNPAVT